MDESEQTVLSKRSPAPENTHSMNSVTELRKQAKLTYGVRRDFALGERAVTRGSQKQGSWGGD